jgi:heterotetrameric sarcosine oxidase gamma subunit
MLERISPIAHSPAAGLSTRRLETLVQFHAWPDRFPAMARELAEACGAANAPAPNRAVQGKRCALLRLHPQRIWLTSDQSVTAPKLAPEIGVVLDLAHARSVIHIDAAKAAPLLSRFITVDLRPEHFAIDRLAITPLHRVSVVLWRRADGIDILAPRSFAASLWDLLAETAERL